MRREWIEIRLTIPPQEKQGCLPPCGGSGLKWKVLIAEFPLCLVSLHAEGEWIENVVDGYLDDELMVSLHAEGVD